MAIDLFQISSIMGLLLISGGTILGSIKKGRSYPLFIIGGIFLLIYSIYLNNIVFILLQIIFIISSIYGLFRIKKQKN